MRTKTRSSLEAVAVGRSVVQSDVLESCNEICEEGNPFEFVGVSDVSCVYSARTQDGPQKWKLTKQQPNMLPGPAVPGSCLVSLHILWAILSTSTVLYCER